MNRERFNPLGIAEKNPESAALAAAVGVIVLGLVILRAVKEPDHIQKTDPNSQPVKEGILEGGLNSAQEYNEQVVEPKSIEKILSYMLGRENQKVVALAEELKGYYEAGGIYVTDEQTAEESHISASQGRFPGTLMVWGKSTLDQPGVRIEIPSDELNDPRKSIADWAIIFAANLRFARLIEHVSTMEQIVEIRDGSYNEVATELAPKFAGETRLFHSRVGGCFDADVECAPISQK